MTWACPVCSCCSPSCCSDLGSWAGWEGTDWAAPPTFPPWGGRERLAYWVYQLSSAGVLVCLCAQRAEVEGAWPFWAGLVLYLLGLALCAGAVVSFGRPSPGPFREDGLYRFSRNPMYVSYFVYFAGCVLLTRSRLLAALVLLFQLSEHWIILAEERWCREQFGAPYEAYRKRVRRYL